MSGTDACHDLAYLDNLFILKVLSIFYRNLRLRLSTHYGDWPLSIIWTPNSEERDPDHLKRDNSSSTDACHDLDNLKRDNSSSTEGFVYILSKLTSSPFSSLWGLAPLDHLDSEERF